MGDLPVESVLYAPPLRYLLVVLKSEGPPTREAFLALRPDVQRLEAAHAGGQLVGVIVTLQGAWVGACEGLVCVGARARTRMHTCVEGRGWQELLN